MQSYKKSKNMNFIEYSARAADAESSNVIEEALKLLSLDSELAKTSDAFDTLKEFVRSAE